KCEGTGGLERHVRGVHAVRFPVDERDPDVDHRVSHGRCSLGQLRADALLDRWDELARHGAADDLVDELESGPVGKGLELDRAHSVLAVSSALLDVSAQPCRRATYGFA